MLLNGLVLDHLKKVYNNSTIALNSLSYEYPLDHGVIGIIGPNGAGKTTLLSILATVNQPTSGRAKLKGLDVVGDRIHLRKNISYLPQDIRPFLYSLSGRDYIIEYLRMRGENIRFLNERVEPLIEELNLQYIIDKPIGRVSGGEAKKIFIVAALSVDAEIYILDEPSAGLDPPSRIKLWSLIRSLAGDGKLVIVASHYTEELAIHCDEILILDKGSLLIHGSPSKILEKMFAIKEKIVVRGVENRSLNSVKKAVLNWGVDRIVSVGDTIFIYPREKNFYGLITKLRDIDTSWRIEVSNITLEDYVITLLGDSIESS